jgi:hypothetical protein
LFLKQQNGYAALIISNCFVFFISGAPWTETVDALMSNTAERSKIVTLVFERELPDDEEDTSSQ